MLEEVNFNVTYILLVIRSRLVMFIVETTFNSMLSVLKITEKHGWKNKRRYYCDALTYSRNPCSCLKPTRAAWIRDSMSKWKWEHEKYIKATSIRNTLSSVECRGMKLNEAQFSITESIQEWGAFQWWNHYSKLFYFDTCLHHVLVYLQNSQRPSS